MFQVVTEFENKKVALAVLTKGYTDLESYNTLIIRNNLIHQNILTKTNLEYDMIIFHEGNITPEHIEYITVNSQPTLIFKNVKECGNGIAFDDNKNKINSTLCPPTELSDQFPLGYKHMCHFWSIDFFDYLSEYDYVLRIDEDCYIDRVDPSVFETIVEQGITFAVPLICEVLDTPEVIVGLDILTKNFLTERGWEMSVPYEDIRAPNTNFMMVNLKYFREHKLVQDYLQEVDKSHGIYSNRWGDAPIWGIILYILSGEAFFELSDTGYLHGSHNHYVNPNTI
jgi:hypothetical protein